MDSKQPAPVQENVLTQFGRAWNGVDNRKLLGGCAAVFGVALLFLAWHSSGEMEIEEFDQEDSPVPVRIKKKKKKKSSELILPPPQAGQAASDILRAPLRASPPSILRPMKFSSLRANVDLVGDGPCHIYTQVIDDRTHNIIFFSVPDWRSKVAVEPVNISHTSRTVEDFLDLGSENMHGQTLAYRIIVKDEKVVGVLMQDEGVRKMDFKEHKVPEEGDIVEVTYDGSIGVVKCVPILMVVTNRDSGDDEVTEKKIEYDRKRRPTCRHFDEIHGYIDVDIVRKHGHWKKVPVREAQHVTYLKHADPGVIDEYYSWKTDDACAEVDSFDTQYMSIVENIEKLFNSAGEEAPDDKTFSKIEDYWKQCQKISSKVSDDCLHKTKEVVTEIRNNIMRTKRLRRVLK